MDEVRITITATTETEDDDGAPIKTSVQVEYVGPLEDFPAFLTSTDYRRVSEMLDDARSLN